AAVQTHPLDRRRPCVLERTVKIPAGEKTRLLISVSHHTHGDFQLVVRADGKVLEDRIVGAKTVKDEWADLQIDLSSYAGKQVKLTIENKPNDWRNEWAYWNQIKLVGG
ncbi:MAG: hypothetical protein VB875_08170, partial [Pirellulales bacterium]